MAERLLDDDPAGLRQPGLGEPFDNRAEEEGRNLEVEDRGLSTVDRGRNSLIRRRVGEVTALIREPLRKAVENLLVDLLTRPLDRLARTFLQVVVGPVVDSHADDRAVEEPAGLEPVERMKGHHFREVAGDTEDDEDIGDLRLSVPRRRGHRFALGDGVGALRHSPTSLGRP